MRFRNNKYLYFDISNTVLILAVLQKSHDIFTVNNFKVIDLEPFVVNNGIIFNPTQIVQHVNDFLQQHKLNNPSTFVACSWLTEKDTDLELRLSILQLLLCLCKADVAIKQMTKTSLFNVSEIKQGLRFSKESMQQLKNLLDMVIPSKSNGKYLWLLMLLLLLGLGLGIAYFFQHRYQCLLSDLEKQRMSVFNEIKELEVKTQGFAMLKKTSVSREIALNKILKIVGHKKKYSEFLIEISKAISDEICLSEICIDTKQIGQVSQVFESTSRGKSVKLASSKETVTSGKVGKFINIKGFASDPGGIMIFVKNLSKIPSIEKIEMNCIKQAPDGSNSYSFELGGRLKA